VKALKDLLTDEIEHWKLQGSIVVTYARCGLERLGWPVS
jgi:hypothetical protein